MLTLRHIEKSFDGNRVLRNVSARIEAGELIGIVGPSGGGKSVLLKILAQVLAPDGGEIESASTVHTGMLFQEGALFDSMPVLENVAFALHEAEPDLSYNERMQRSYSVLAEVGLGKDYHKMPGQLSGGMRRRVALARAVVARPELVLLDDPTGGLDPVAASVIMNLIVRLHQQHHVTFVIVSHDLRRLLPCVERLWCLFEGTIAYDCAPRVIADTASETVLRFLQTRFDFGSGFLTTATSAG